MVDGQEVSSYVIISSLQREVAPNTYSLRFKIKVTLGHKLCYEIKVTYGEISLKFRQTSRNVAKNNVNVVANELPSQITVYTCLTIDIWTLQHSCTSTRFYAHPCHPPKLEGFV